MNEKLALVIEDDYDTSIIFARALREAGYDTQVIRSGDAALRWLETITPVLVVLDLNLPGASGVEIIRRIRADARLAGTRIIIATPYPHLTEALSGEADSVLVRPVGFSQLRDLAAQLAQEKEER